MNIDMNKVEKPELSSNSSSAAIADPPTVLGPFATIIRYSGFDLSNSDLRKSSNWVLSLLGTTICVTLCASIFALFIIIAFAEPMPLTIAWAESCLMTSQLLMAFVAAVSLAALTRTPFIRQFQDHLSRCRIARVSPGEWSDQPVFRKAVIYSFISLVIWIMTSSKGFIYPIIARNGTNAQLLHIKQICWRWAQWKLPLIVVMIPTCVVGCWEVSLQTLYGAEPFIVFVGGLATTLAISYHVLLHISVNRELLQFNEEFNHASQFQQLGTYDLLMTFCRRHYDLLSLVKALSMHLGKFTTLAGPCAVAQVIFSMFLFIAYKNDLSHVYKVTVFLWNILSTAHTVFILGLPAKTQKHIHNTTQILLQDEAIQSTVDPKTRHVYQLMLERCQSADTKLTFLNALVVDRRFVHKVFLIAPQFGTLLVIMKQLIKGH